MSRRRLIRGHWILVLALLAAGPLFEPSLLGQSVAVDRSPVDLVISPAGDWLATANQTSDSVSLVDVATRSVVAEQPVGRHPIGIALHPDGERILVSCRDGGEVHVLRVRGKTLVPDTVVTTGFHPWGVTCDPVNSELAYVALSADDRVAILNLEEGKLTGSIPVGRWPRYLAVSPDATRMVVGTPGDRGISHVDLVNRELSRIERFVGLNIGEMAIAPDGEQVYFPWMVYRQNPITPNNIQLGWVLASRLARTRFDGSSRREALSLDPPGEAVADPHGVAVTPDGQQVLVTSSGTHELLFFRTEDLPLQARGSTDHIPPELLEDRDRFDRIEVGGRPLGVEIANDGQSAWIANYLLNSVQQVDLSDRRLIAEIPLGSAETLTAERRGEFIFYDAGRSLDQWYSCHSCHYEGGTNSVAMDTFNDDSARTFKTVLPLFELDQTGPWTWHGHREDLPELLTKSLTVTLRGESPSAADVDDLRAYLAALQSPPNPHRPEEDRWSAEQLRGKALFEGKGACAECHQVPLWTDGEIHDLGLGQPEDRHRGFNTPSLAGVYERVLLLHDGRAKSLEKLLAEDHAPENVAGEKLTPEERADLIAYLKTL